MSKIPEKHDGGKNEETGISNNRDTIAIEWSLKSSVFLGAVETDIVSFKG